MSQIAEVEKVEMPKYVCHKEVWAFKILKIIPVRGEDSVVLVPFDDRIKRVTTVEPNYLEMHSPHVGGYYVRYKDGYESYSPAEAFESGYTLMD